MISPYEKKGICYWNTATCLFIFQKQVKKKDYWAAEMPDIQKSTNVSVITWQFGNENKQKQ